MRLLKFKTTALESTLFSFPKFVKKITIHLTAFYHDLFANDKRTELFVEKVNEILEV